MAGAGKIEDHDIIENPVHCTFESVLFCKALFPELRLFVAGKDNVETAFLVVTAVNHVKEKPCVFNVKIAVADFINNQA